MPRSAARAATRRNRAPRSACSRSATSRSNWDPKRQRPELWHLANTKIGPGESMRVFPLSNWTELDVWTYIYLEDIPVVPLYFAADRPVVERGGMLIMVDDDAAAARRQARSREMARVRFRTLGCYPLTGAIRSDAATVPEIIEETDRRALFGAAGPGHRPRSVGFDGEEEAGGLFLMPRLSVVGSGRTDASARVDARVAAEEDRSLLRFLTCGSVDDGKSTLIGRLLYDSAAGLRGPAAQRRAAISAVRQAGRRQLDLALLIDGLQAEREQKITIDVAYRYFATPRRKFIVADTPGHVQYTRNMATGASNCDFAVLLVDARERHADPDAPARLHPVAARHPQGRAGRQQDGSGRFRSGAVRGDRRGLCRLRARTRLRAGDRHSRSRRSRATT